MNGVIPLPRVREAALLQSVCEMRAIVSLWTHRLGFEADAQVDEVRRYLRARRFVASMDLDQPLSLLLRRVHALIMCDDADYSTFRDVNVVSIVRGSQQTTLNRTPHAQVPGRVDEVDAQIARSPRLSPFQRGSHPR